jgi:hypothetical protein
MDNIDPFDDDGREKGEWRNRKNKVIKFKSVIQDLL